MKTFLVGCAVIVSALVPLRADSPDTSPSIDFSFPAQDPQFNGATAKYDDSGVFQSWHKLNGPDGVLAFRDDDISSYYLIFYALPAGQNNPTVENVGFENAQLTDSAPVTSFGITFNEKVGSATLKKTGEKMWLSATTFSVGNGSYYMICYGSGDDDSSIKECVYKRKEIIDSIRPFGYHPQEDTAPAPLETPPPVSTAIPKAMALTKQVSDLSSFPVATPVPGKKGIVLSPWSSDNKVDVSDFAPGTAVVDPYTARTFVVPKPADAASSPSQ